MATKKTPLTKKKPTPAAQELMDNAPKQRSSASRKPKHFANIVSFRECDVDKSLVKFLRKVQARGKFDSTSDVALALLRLAEHSARTSGIGYVVPMLKKFRG